jgi:uncharacterized protein (DUF1810 family)
METDNPTDVYRLSRFVEAQDPVYARVLEELGRGRKASHWMWFVFPQLRGLGRSEMAVRFAISGRAEAEAYLKHSVLGVRLKECTRLVNRIDDSASAIFGYPDDLKFRSSMTLFASVKGGGVFQEALDKFFGGERDSAALALL